jgi:hypothetical protein
MGPPAQQPTAHSHSHALTTAGCCCFCFCCCYYYCCFHCCCCYGWLLIIALLLRPEQDSLSVEQREAWRRSLPGASRSARIDSRIAPPSKFPGGWRRRRLGKFGDSQRRITRGNDLKGDSNATVRVTDVGRWHVPGWCHPYSKH